ncbi:fructosamine kinase family protein [Georgenia sp. SYP-B2076]|uniref:fructosamine kinase family protein n=1 Tax=Georgenia sp. SYP-B2076 TaxID=2495881 RepID=UPI000F8C53CA|nr:fructosamine kinase family protein [Georgenia sp. SYP-B2076]
MTRFRKGDHGDPATVRFEAAGLRWLGEAVPGGGAAVVEVLAEGPGWLETRRVSEGRPDAAAAEDFGRAVARTHAAGAPHFGAPPAGWSAEGFMGRAPLPLRAAAPAGRDSWGRFYAEERILPYLAAATANGSIDSAGARTVERCAARVADGALDAPQPGLVRGAVARVHGDLWSGNVLWARDGAGTSDRARPGEPGHGVVATLIDPAAHGGHAESDLAQLALFGAPHLDRILGAYAEASPPAPGWRERVGLHQLHMLVVHAALFGGPYGAQTVRTAARYA